MTSRGQAGRRSRQGTILGVLALGLALGLALAGPPAQAAGSCSGKVVAPAAAGTCAVNGAPCTHPGDPA